jgi:hypothetical protein
MSHSSTRRTFIQKSTIATASLIAGSPFLTSGKGQINVNVINPYGLPPVSFIIDDSTALVNMAYYGIPQFKEVFPEQYQQDWKALPREIPDSFVMEFGEWCNQHGVKGKYSMVPYPACTGWLNRFIPGWSKREMEDSIKYVRDYLQPDWDIHPEMISHTRVIDITKGVPFPSATPEFMENWEWSQDKSADELAGYIGYALNILKESELYCEGVTTPGGFCHRNMDNLALGTLEASREIYGTEIAHFFRDVRTDPEESVVPELFHVSGLETNDPKCSVHIIGCTGDWFGGWDGLVPGDSDKFITDDLQQGRMVEVIDSGQPAIMVCHWPGIYYNGTKLGFNIFKTVVQRLEEKYGSLNWMKLSEISRYWAAKELTKIEVFKNEITFNAPFASKGFTIHVDTRVKKVKFTAQNQEQELSLVKNLLNNSNSFVTSRNSTNICFNLPKGESKIILN